jgi:hypothetical protein
VESWISAAGDRFIAAWSTPPGGHRRVRRSARPLRCPRRYFPRCPA